MGPDIRYSFAFTVPADSLRKSTLLYDHQALDGCGGIDPTDYSNRDYPEHSRKTLSSWLDDLKGQTSRTVLIQTWRNAVQNPRCIMWSREQGICQSRHEHAERSRRPYYGIAVLKSGKLRAVKFLPSAGMPDDDVQQFGAGIPVLWSGQVLTIEQIAPEVADLSHLWRLPVSSTYPTSERDRETFDRLRAVFELHRHATTEEAAEAILDAARGRTEPRIPALAREENYLHQAIGVLPDGGLVIVVAHGSLEQIGELAREAGATHAVVIDNGGSPAIALKRRPDAELRTLVESYYHRPLSIAAAVHEIEGEPEARFVSQRGMRSPVRSLRKREGVVLTYGTEFGPVRKELSFQSLNWEAAGLAAIEIGNFAFTHGAFGVRMQSCPEFSAHVVSRFRERYRATHTGEDPTKLLGRWAENYLADVYGSKFELGGVADLERAAPVGQHFHATAQAKTVIGLDLGGTNVKCLVVVNGKTAGESVVKTLRTNPDFSSPVFKAKIEQAVKSAVCKAKIKQSDIQAVGVSFAAAVRDGRAATAKLILDMNDVLSWHRGVPVVNTQRLDEVRNLGQFVRSALPALSPSARIASFNDGEVEAQCEAQRLGRREVLLVKLGATVAGGYVDAQGRTDYLTEIGRVVLRADSEAPRHPYSQIQGLASRLIGTEALYEMGTAAGLSVSRDDAGRDFSRRLDNSPPKRRIVEEMGRNLADLLVEVTRHLPPIQHVIIRGGLAGNHAVGQVLRSQTLANVPRDLADRVKFEDESVHSGAFAAAWLAARI